MILTQETRTCGKSGLSWLGCLQVSPSLKMTCVYRLSPALSTGSGFSRV